MHRDNSTLAVVFYFKKNTEKILENCLIQRDSLLEINK